MHGERLARINRWEFHLDESLEGESVGQPVFVAMAGVHERHPWNRGALDAITAAARRAATTERYSPAEPLLVGALVESLTGVTATPPLGRLGCRILSSISSSQTRPIGEAEIESQPSPRGSLTRALRDTDLSDLPRSWCRFLAFVAAAVDELTKRGTGTGPTLGLLTRLRLLVSARFFC
jgi:hypothetical protein